MGKFATILALFFHNGKVCNDPGSVFSQWGKFAMILALFHNGEICNGSRLCFTMGKFTMLLLALFHSGKIYNAPGSVHNEKIIRIKH
jgi:hypothetical protein